MDMTSFWITLKIFFGVASVIVALIWFIRMRNWQLRNLRLSAIMPTTNTINTDYINYKWMVRTPGAHITACRSYLYSW